MKKTILLLICLFISTSCLFAGDFVIKDGVLLKYKGNSTNLVIPNGVKTISKNAFNRHLDGETDDLFRCITISIPASVTNISCDFSFHMGHGGEGSIGFNKLTSINVSKDNKNYSSIDGVLFNKNKTKLICYPSKKKDYSYTIPNTVTYIAPYAFSCCEVKDITIPINVQRLGCCSFNDFTIKKLTIKNPNIILGDEDSNMVFHNSVYIDPEFGDLFTTIYIPNELKKYFVDPNKNEYNFEISCLGYSG